MVVIKQWVTTDTPRVLQWELYSHYHRINICQVIHNELCCLIFLAPLIHCRPIFCIIPSTINVAQIQSF